MASITVGFPSRNYDYIYGNGSPDVRELFVLAGPPAGLPQTPDNAHDLLILRTRRRRSLQANAFFSSGATLVRRSQPAPG